MSEEQTQQLLYQMQMLESYFSELTQKEGSIISIIREASFAIDSLKAVDNKTDDETLVPLGLGTFVKTKLIPNQKLILNVGAGIAIEKDASYFTGDKWAKTTSFSKFRTRKTTNESINGCIP